MPFNDEGFELVPDFITQTVAQKIKQETNQVLIKQGGLRHVDKKSPAVNDLAHSETLLGCAQSYLGQPANLVRAILFDKTFENNWFVTWHQDKTVAVTQQFDSPEWTAWSVKEGVLHVQPPLSVLNTMVTIRIHLDDCFSDNGGLKIIPASHLLGIVNQADIPSIVQANTIYPIEAPALSALIMRPHLLHASSKSVNPNRRRILHLEYSSFELSKGVFWA